MKIDGNLPQTGLQAPRTERVEQPPQVEPDDRKAASSAKAQVEKDRLDISKTAEQISQAVSQGKEQEASFRADRVEAVKAQVESGKYQVNSKDVAQKMLSFIQNGLSG